MIEIEKIPLLNFTPIVEVVGCFLEQNEKILYLLRANNKEEGNRWGVPGGKVEPNETIFKASIRELEEEIGLKLQESDVTYLLPLYIRKNGKDFIFHLMKMTTPTSFSIILNEEHTDARWFLPEELPLFPMVLGSEKALFFYQEARASIKSFL